MPGSVYMGLCLCLCVGGGVGGGGGGGWQIVLRQTVVKIKGQGEKGRQCDII